MAKILQTLLFGSLIALAGCKKSNNEVYTTQEDGAITYHNPVNGREYVDFKEDGTLDMVTGPRADGFTIMIVNKDSLVKYEGDFRKIVANYHKKHGGAQ